MVLFVYIAHESEAACYATHTYWAAIKTLPNLPQIFYEFIACKHVFKTTNDAGNQIFF